MTSSPGRKDVFAAALRGMLLETHTALVAEVKDWDKKTRTITAQPLLQRKTAGGELRTLSPIPRVPVMYPGGDEWEIFWPMAAGDEVLLIVCERSIDTWLEKGGITDPGDARIHDLKDSFAIPRTWSLGGVRPAEDGALVLQKTDGSVRIELRDSGNITITGSEVKLGDGTAIDPVALSSIVDSILNSIVTAFNLHTHTGPSSGTTSVPTALMTKPPSTAATKVKAK